VFFPPDITVSYKLQQTPQQITLAPSAPATGAMIWLHGLGASADDFVPVFQHLASMLKTPLYGIFPQADNLPVTINGGMAMPAWYDILGATPQRVIEQTSFAASVTRIHMLIDQLIAEGIRSEHIVIAGFSQGGAVAMEAALTCPHTLGALICLSTYQARPFDVAAANANLPIFQAHGHQDNVVPVELGLQAQGILQTAGLHPQWQTYAMDHEVCLDEINDIAQFCTPVFR